MMHLFQEERYISRIYYESMRDNFEGYAWETAPTDPGDDNTAQTNTAQTNAAKADQLDKLRSDFSALDPLDNQNPTLGQLFRIELALIRLIPNEALRARFWTIEDRFRRVVPTSVARSYDSSFAPPGDPGSGEPGSFANDGTEEVLRQRARTLLDVIHANYLINLARENSIRRMMTIVALAAFVIVAAGITFSKLFASLALHGLLIIVIAGMVGAMISIIQRLQKATSRDAMVEDGIFELIGLRVGWVSILMSIGIGGVFALFIYLLVCGNLLDQLLPHVPVDDGAIAPPGDIPTADPTMEQGADPQPEPAGAIASDIPATDATGLAAAAVPEAGLTSQQATGAPDMIDTANAASCCSERWVDRVTQGLGLTARTDFYKMVVTAFISGFAERFVPDIINRLGKQNPASPGFTPPGSNSPAL